MQYIKSNYDLFYVAAICSNPVCTGNQVCKLNANCVGKSTCDVAANPNYCTCRTNSAGQCLLGTYS